MSPSRAPRLLVVLGMLATAAILQAMTSSGWAAPPARFVSPPRHRPVTGYTCLTAQTRIERLEEAVLLVDGRELARLDDPEKIERLIRGATFCLDTADLPDGRHRIQVRFTGDGGRRGVATMHLATDNPPFRLRGVFPERDVYRGGEVITMILEATHPGLDVAVDFSRVDSRYGHGAEHVQDLGDGRYRVTYGLSTASRTAVGLHPLSIRIGRGHRSRTYRHAISVGFLPRRDNPLSLAGDPAATQIFAPFPHATGSPLRILALRVRPTRPVRIGESVILEGVVGAGDAAPARPLPVAAPTLFLAEAGSDGFYRTPLALGPCPQDVAGCVGSFQVALELTEAGAGGLRGAETLLLQLAIEDARGGISPAAGLPVPAEPVIGVPLPPPVPFHVTGRFIYRSPAPVFDQNGPNDVELLSNLEIQRPVRFADVAAVRDDDVVLATGKTNKDGYYALTFANPAGGFVRVEARSRVNTPTRKVQVFDSSQTIYARATSAYVPQFEPDKTLDHTIFSPSARPFLILDNMIRGFDFVLDFGGVLLPQLNVLWELHYAQGHKDDGYVGGRDCTRTSYYSRTEIAGGLLHLTSKTPNTLPKLQEVEDEDSGLLACAEVPGQFWGGDHDDFDSPVQLHEFGHFLQHHVTRAESCAHGSGPPRSAWCEGAPTAIGQTVLASPFYYDRTFNDDGVEVFGVYSVDQNTGGTDNQALMPVCGEYSDGWVWRLLWDFLDPPSAVPLQLVWNWGGPLPSSGAVPEPVTVAEGGVNFGSDFDRLGNVKLVMQVLRDYLGVDHPAPPDRGPGGPELVDFLDGWFAQGGGQGLDVLTLAFEVMRFNYDFAFLGANLCAGP